MQFGNSKYLECDSTCVYRDTAAEAREATKKVEAEKAKENK